MGASVKAFSPAVYHIMLPWCHPMPAVFGIQNFIASLKKIAFAVYKQAADQIFWIKRDFHILFPKTELYHDFTGRITSVSMNRRKLRPSGTAEPAVSNNWGAEQAKNYSCRSLP